MKLRNLTLAVAGAALIAGCSHHSGSLASGHPLASVPGYDKTAAIAILTRDGVPVHGTAQQQLAFGKKALTKDGRTQIAQQLAIPPANRKPFEAELLADAEHDHLLSHTKAGLKTLLEVQLPQLVEKYQR